MSNDEQQQQFVGVREGAVATYLAKSKPSRHSREGGNPAVPNWQIKRLGDFARTASGGTPKRDKPQFYGGSILWVKSGELRDGLVREAEESITELGLDSSSAKIFPKGTLCIALYGATVGRLGILDIEASTNQAVCGIFPSQEVDAKYLFYFLFSKRSSLIRDAKGGAQPNISQQIVRDLEVPVPPLDEQRRIVAELETQLTRLDASVTALKRVQANLKRYRASVLKAACEGRLVPTEAELARREGRSYESGSDFVERVVRNRRAVWESQPVNARRKKYQEPQAPSGSPTGLPEGWAWGTLDQLSLLDVGFAFKSAEFTNEGIRLLRGENMEPGAFRWAETRHWPESKLQGFEHLLIQEGQIVLAMDRPLISAGLKIARARASDLPCLLVQRMARFRPVLIEMTTFLYQAMQGEAFIKHLLGGQTGTQLPHISGEGIQGFLVQAPPLAEQHRIVAEVERRLSVIEELEATVAANLKRAERLRQAVLSRAFAGGA